MKKKITFVVPCFNEEKNILNIYEGIKKSVKQFSNKFIFDYIFIDNNSFDNSRKILKDLALADKKVKLIFNNRNFGPVRSPYYGLLESNSDAAILIAADLQEPVEIIPDFINSWANENYKIVLGAKKNSDEAFLMKIIRRRFYDFINSISDVPLDKNVTGFGLFDRDVIKLLKQLDDPYPYFRGLICELGFKRKLIYYFQPKRKFGYSKASFFGMLDQALLAMTKHSKLPLRIMTLFGILLGGVSFLMSIIFIVLKIIYWDSFPLGMTPILAGLFFIASILFFFLGILGEYVGSILTHIRKIPHVTEEERINF